MLCLTVELRSTCNRVGVERRKFTVSQAPFVCLSGMSLGICGCLSVSESVIGCVPGVPLGVCRDVGGCVSGVWVVVCRGVWVGGCQGCGWVCVRNVGGCVSGVWMCLRETSAPEQCVCRRQVQRLPSTGPVHAERRRTDSRRWHDRGGTAASALAATRLAVEQDA